MFCAPAVNAQTASDYYNRGNTKQVLEDYKGAIEDYNKAVELGNTTAVDKIKIHCN